MTSVIREEATVICTCTGPYWVDATVPVKVPFLPPEAGAGVAAAGGIAGCAAGFTVCVGAATFGGVDVAGAGVSGVAGDGVTGSAEAGFDGCVGLGCCVALGGCVVLGGCAGAESVADRVTRAAELLESPEAPVCHPTMRMAVEATIPWAIARFLTSQTFRGESDVRERPAPSRRP